MTLGFYKPGQGYWTRVLTATIVGVLTLGAAAWIYSQMRLVVDSLPKTVWSMVIPNTGATPTEGQTVTLLGQVPGGGGVAPEIGTGRVLSFASGELRFDQLQMKDTTQVADPKASGAAAVRVGSGAPVAFSQVHGDIAVSPWVIEGGAMVLVLVFGSFLAYYLSSMNRRFVDFLIATDGEMKKVNWSTARDIRMSTVVVIFASLVLAGCLFASDFVFQWFFTTIGVLAH